MPIARCVIVFSSNLAAGLPGAWCRTALHAEHLYFPDYFGLRETFSKLISSTDEVTGRRRAKLPMHIFTRGVEGGPTQFAATARRTGAGIIRAARR